MLAKRIIPCLDIKDGRVVKGVNFVNIKDAGDPVDNAVFYDKEKADEVVFLDITATYEKRATLIDLARRVAESLFIPFTIGGGIRTVEDMRNLLVAGADKIAINSAAVKNPALISDGAKMFGSQCIVLACDAKRRAGGGWEVYVAGGRTPTGIDVLTWIKDAESRGAGEVLLTSMDCDGTKNGFDNELNAAVATMVKIPVIASGGAGNVQHMVDAFTIGKADAVLAASIFHYRELSIGDVRTALKNAGINVR
ncbi:MAG: imidazole glycerol phosphate synthase subunit HisF [Spirochaetes bacterium]|nr:imidazole glycerol phosphate synthase subunit HisF [Spirochaetota bacterium]